MTTTDKPAGPDGCSEQPPEPDTRSKTLMPPTNLPTTRPPRRRPADAIQVAPIDVARFGPGAALVLSALQETGEPMTRGDLGARTGLDTDTATAALFELLAFRRTQTDYVGRWWLRPDEDLDSLRAHVERTAAGAELEASNITTGGQR